MSGRTPRFNLNMFGAGVSGTITDDGQKYTSLDRFVLDRVMNALELHTHQGGTRLLDPTDAPLLSLNTAAGTLPAGTTFFYRCSYVDQYGLETAASPEISITTPSPISPPGAPFATAAVVPDQNTDGSPDTNPGVRTGVTYYALSSIKGDTETSLSDPAIINVLSDRRQITLTFPSVPDSVTSFGVWRKGASEAGYTKIDTVDAVANGTYIDEGAVSPSTNPLDPSNQPPSINLTNSTNTVTITVPGADLVTADPSAVKRWRVYRSRTSGVYSSQSLIADVVSTANADGSGGLVSTFADDGTVTAATGAPLNLSQTLTPSATISFPVYETEDDLPSAATYANGAVVYVTAPSLAAYINNDGTWQQNTGAGVTPVLVSPSNKRFLLQVLDDGTLATSELLPAQVTGVTGTPDADTAGQIDLSWTYVSPQDANPVLNYTIVATPASGSALAAVTTSTAATTYNYSGLTSSTAYTFTVTANNLDGAGETSDASAAVTAP